MEHVDQQLRLEHAMKYQQDLAGWDSGPATPVSANFSDAPTVRNLVALNEKTRWSGPVPVIHREPKNLPPQKTKVSRVRAFE